MLTIRQEQMQLLESEMERAFAQRLARAMSSCFPDHFERMQGANREEDYRELIGRVIDRAERFGIERENDIAAFVLLALVARNLDGAAAGFLDWTHPIILNEAIAGAAKIPLIERRLKREAAADASTARVVEMLRIIRADE